MAKSKRTKPAGTPAEAKGEWAASNGMTLDRATAHMTKLLDMAEADLRQRIAELRTEVSRLTKRGAGS